MVLHDPWCKLSSFCDVVPVLLETSSTPRSHAGMAVVKSLPPLSDPSTSFHAAVKDRSQAADTITQHDGHIGGEHMLPLWPRQLLLMMSVATMPLCRSPSRKHILSLLKIHGWDDVGCCKAFCGRRFGSHKDAATGAPPCPHRRYVLP